MSVATAPASVAPARSSRLPAPLPGPFSVPPEADLRPLAATRRLAATQVRALLAATPAFHALPVDARADLTTQMERVAAYAAELVRDDWWQSSRLGQRPVLVRRATAPVRAQAAGDELRNTATDRVAAVTRRTLRAIAFPEFVADLIRSTFRAIVDAGIQQLEAFRALLDNVSSTVDEFEQDNITDNQARDWLVQRYPEALALDGEPPRVVPLPGVEDAGPPRWRSDLGLPRDVDPADEDAIEDVLVPAARRRLAQQRLQTLSLLVVMGLNRIVVTGGKIRATMAFHIDASDAARQANATDFDLRVAASGSVGFGPWSASVTTSVGYVNSTRTESESEINVAADLTGEVELHFRSDAVALERLLDDGGIGRVVGNTPVPAANEPIPWGASPEARVAPSARRTSARIDAPPRVAPEPPPVPPRPATPSTPSTPGPTPSTPSTPGPTPAGGTPR